MRANDLDMAAMLTGKPGRFLDRRAGEAFRLRNMFSLAEGTKAFKCVDMAGKGWGGLDVLAALSLAPPGGTAAAVVDGVADAGYNTTKFFGF